MELNNYTPIIIDLKDNYLLGFDLECHQNDTPTFCFEIRNYGELVRLSDVKVDFRFTKPDGSIYIQVRNKITIENNSIIKVECLESLTNKNGIAKGSIRIWDTTGQIATRLIHLNITNEGLQTDDKVNPYTLTCLDELNDIINRFSEMDELVDRLKEYIPLGEDLHDRLIPLVDNSREIYNKLKPLYDDSVNINDRMEKSNDTAKLLKGELQTLVDNAEDTKNDLKLFDTDGIIENTNLMLQETYCNNELFTLKHDLNAYPMCQMIYTEYGAGVGGAGVGGAGGAESTSNLMQCKVVHIDKNNIKVYVPNRYYFEGSSLQKINKYQYIITFSASNNSILMNLIGLEDSKIENVKEEINDSLNTINDNLIYETAGGTSTAITLSNIVLKNGYPKTFIASYTDNSTTKTINGKPFYRPNTTVSPNTIQGKAYTIWYDSSSDCFFIKASAEGDALAENVLANKKFSNDYDTNLIGSMSDNSGIDVTITNQNQEYIVAKGFHNGLGKVKAIITNLIASVIKYGETVGGIVGTFTSDGTITASDVLSGKIGYSKGNQVIGNIPNNGAMNANLNCGQSKDISAGYISGGAITANSLASQTPANADASTIIAGRNAWVNGNLINGNASVQSLGGKKFATGSFGDIAIDTNVTASFGFRPSSIVGYSGSWAVLSYRVGSTAGGGLYSVRTAAVCATISLRDDGFLLYNTGGGGIIPGLTWYAYE